MSAGLESRVQLLRASGNEPTHGLQSRAGGGLAPRSDEAMGLASGRPRNGPAAGTDEGVLLRLSLWLAEVAAEAALASTTRPETGPTRESVVVEPAS